jgi:hypothetical protein
MKRKFSFLILGLCIFCLSCKKKRNPDVEPITPDIYLAGGSTENGNHVVQYWKNDEVVNLASLNYMVGDVYIAVSGPDIHVASNTVRIGNFYGLYWKNGIVTASTNHTVPQWMSDLKVSGQNVYIVGSNEGSEYATYWKNGEAITYTDVVKGSAYGIFLSGNDVYLAGSASIGGKRVASYWKNGTRVTLGKDKDTSYGLAIAVKDNDVYVVGHTGLNLTENGYYATYWKNGVEVSLTNHSEDYSVAVDVAISGSDVYIVGYVKKGNTKEAKIWKNGEANTLLSGNSVSSIFAHEGDIYVAGSGGGSFDGGRAMYWKNGNPTFLSDGKRSVWVSSIFVKNP